MMKKLLLTLSLICFTTQYIASAQTSDPTYKNSEASLNDRVEDLFDRMTLEEKIGQMTQLNISMINQTGAHDDVTIDSSKVIDLVKNHHIGSFLNGEAVPVEEWYTYMNELTRLAYKHSRLDIPIIYGIDHVHGANYMRNSTVFPQNINLGATFNDQHAVNEARVTVNEFSFLAQHWLFAPILDLGRNPFWPRLYETYGEDPYVASRMGASYVKTIRNISDTATYKIAASGKHFLGYSDPRSGWDRTPALLPMQQIHEFFRPPFQAAIDSGLKTIMLNSGELNGRPVHSDKEIVSDLLRDQMGFDGVIVTDWADIKKLVNHHHTARNMKEATLQAINAGIDVSMTPNDLSFNEALLELVDEGKVTEKRINESVRRILRLKFELDIFEQPFPSKQFDKVGAPGHKEQARQAARESIVLLKNDDRTLPLPTDLENIVLVGPSADSKMNLSGGWTITWQGGPEERYPEEMETVYDALKNHFPEATITVQDSLPENSQNEKQLLSKARKADAVIFALGEKPYAEMPGNINTLYLPDYQTELVKLFRDVETPKIMVMIEGRPRIITGLQSDADAVLFAGLPGYEGGTAIAEILSGKVNPSGKLPISYPKYSGVYFPYNYKINVQPPAEGNEEIVSQMNVETNLYNFGHGLSYTSFSYSDLNLSADTLKPDGSIKATVTVTNTGDRKGKESVLWFVRDQVGSITRPVKELRHYEKVELEPGEEKNVSFTINPHEDLSFPDEEGEKLLEEGDFTLSVDEHSVPFYLNN